MGRVFGPGLGPGPDGLGVEDVGGLGPAAATGSIDREEDSEEGFLVGRHEMN